MTAPTLKSLAPVLIVEALEPCVEFWTQRFGFANPTSVPGPDGRLLFVILEKDGIEIMYQTAASVAADSPSQSGELTGHSTVLFITVASKEALDAAERAAAGAPVVKARHETFYGATEFYIREPGGNVVGFSAF